MAALNAAGYDVDAQSPNHHPLRAAVTRDQKVTQQAKDALTELIRRYPDSRYAQDARLKTLIDQTQERGDTLGGLIEAAPALAEARFPA